jgi:hypothetical protein
VIQGNCNWTLLLLFLSCLLSCFLHSCSRNFRLQKL